MPYIDQVGPKVNLMVIMFKVDTMLLLRNYIPKLTKSEFHTFLVGSHATIAGFAFGLFVVFGVSIRCIFLLICKRRNNLILL